MKCQQCGQEKADVTDGLLPLAIHFPFKKVKLCSECFDRIWEEYKKYK